jgi:hypothetical protein
MTENNLSGKLRVRALKGFEGLTPSGPLITKD